MGGRRFTVETANRSLVLVRRVLADLQPVYRELRARRRELLRVRVREPGRDRDALESEVAGLRTRVDSLVAELDAIGCQLIDADSGTIRYLAESRDGEIWLCWEPRDPAIQSWCEPGRPEDRRPLEELVGPRVSEEGQRTAR